MEGLWAVAIVLGPILLGLALIAGIVTNRRSQAEKQRTETATRELYREEDQADD